MSLTSVDLLEELRAALDELEPLLAGRIVDIEMSRFRVLADPVSEGEGLVQERGLMVSSSNRGLGGYRAVVGLDTVACRNAALASIPTGAHTRRWE